MLFHLKALTTFYRTEKIEEKRKGVSGLFLDLPKRTFKKQKKINWTQLISFAFVPKLPPSGQVSCLWKSLLLPMFINYIYSLILFYNIQQMNLLYYYFDIFRLLHPHQLSHSYFGRGNRILDLILFRYYSYPEILDLVPIFDFRYYSPL